MKRFYGYIRVSTAKQGEGVSLQEQRAAIESYANRYGFSVIEWFEEKETAAKRGRPLFTLKGTRTFQKLGKNLVNVSRWEEGGQAA